MRRPKLFHCFGVWQEDWIAAQAERRRSLAEKRVSTQADNLQDALVENEQLSGEVRRLQAELEAKDQEATLANIAAADDRSGLYLCEWSKAHTYASGVYLCEWEYTYASGLYLCERTILM
jgi:hypothetical protein